MTAPRSGVPAPALQQDSDQSYRQLPRPVDYWRGKVCAMSLMEWLTISLVSILVWHAWLFRSTLKATERAAEAAVTSAEAVVSVESPFLYFSDLKIDSPTQRSKGPSCGTFITSRNYGRTPALVEAVHDGYCVGDTIPTEPQNRPQYRPEHIPKLIEVISPDATHTAPFWCDVSAEDYARIQRHETYLWLFLRLQYRDFFGNRYDTGFCVRYRDKDAPPGYRLVDVPEYSYHRKHPQK